MIKKIFFTVLLILSFIILYAKPKKKPTDNLPLTNTKWILEKVGDNSVFFSSDTAYIVFYENYKFSGNFGCNIFYGEFGFGKKRINLDYFGSTKKMCANMDVEKLFFKTLKTDITHYYIEKNALYLLYKLQVVCKFTGIEIND